jgi:hypothetical protein
VTASPDGLAMNTAAGLQLGLDRPAPSSGATIPFLAAMSMSLLFHGALIVLTMRTDVGVTTRTLPLRPRESVLVFQSEPFEPVKRAPSAEPPPPSLRPESLPIPPALAAAPPPPVQPVERLTLGIEDGDLNSKNWIGYADYLEHLAPLSESEQAARTLEAGGSDGVAKEAAETAPTSLATEPPSLPGSDPSVPPPTPPAPPALPSAESRPSPPTPKLDDSTVKPAEPSPPESSPGPADQPTANPNKASNAPSPLPANDQPPLPPNVLPGETSRPAIDSPLPPITLPPLPAPGIPAAEAATAIPPGGEPGMKPAPPSSPEAPLEGDASQPPDASPSSAPTPPTPSAPSSDAIPTAAGPKTKSTTGDGEVTDSESDPTGVVSVPPNVWRNGRPIAAKGLSIKTRKPRFTVLTLVTRVPRNPTIEIAFDREGKPAEYRLEVSSGHADIDGPILDAVAAWRASGKQLAKLSANERITVHIRLLLVQ